MKSENKIVLSISYFLQSIFQNAINNIFFLEPNQEDIGPLYISKIISILKKG